MERMTDLLSCLMSTKMGYQLLLLAQLKLMEVTSLQNILMDMAPLRAKGNASTDAFNDLLAISTDGMLKSCGY